MTDLVICEEFDKKICIDKCSHFGKHERDNCFCELITYCDEVGKMLKCVPVKEEGE
jgi:hypothetical protein